MKIAIALMLTLVLVGCANIRHKSFMTANNLLGIKATLADPSGGTSPLPQIFLGGATSITATCTPGSKLNGEVHINSPLSKDKTFFMHVEIDATGSHSINTTKDNVTYKKE